MPLPKPNKAEKEKDFISRCISTLTKNKEFDSQEQRVAVCYTQWREKMEKIKEKVDTKKIVKDMQGNFGGDNESQMKGLQLLKGLATSDDKIANEFMKELDKAMTTISKKLSKDESIEEKDKMLEDKDKVKEEEDEIKDPGLESAQAAFDADAIIIDVEQEVRLPDTDFILEPGDKIQVFPLETEPATSEPAEVASTE